MKKQDPASKFCECYDCTFVNPAQTATTPKPQTPLTDALLDERGNKAILPNDHNATGWSSFDCYAFIDHARSLEIKLQALTQTPPSVDELAKKWATKYRKGDGIDEPFIQVADAIKSAITEATAALQAQLKDAIQLERERNETANAH